MKRPLNLAHRGARKQAPENTVPAFQLAERLGADGVEMDVMLCATGELVVTHDDDLSIHSNATGSVASTPLSNLKNLDFGSHFSTEYAGTQIPTLQEVIDSLNSRMFINIEMKTISLRPHKIAAAVARIISQNNLYKRVLVSSFNPIALRILSELDPQIRIGFLYQFRLPMISIRHLFRGRSLSLNALHPDEQLITPRYMQTALAHGYSVNTWTVNNQQRMRELIGLGVTSIITDYPDLLKNVLDSI